MPPGRREQRQGNRQEPESRRQHQSTPAAGNRTKFSSQGHIPPVVPDRIDRAKPKPSASDRAYSGEDNRHRRMKDERTERREAAAGGGESRRFERINDDRIARLQESGHGEDRRFQRMKDEHHERLVDDVSESEAHRFDRMRDDHDRRAMIDQADDAEDRRIDRLKDQRDERDIDEILNPEIVAINRNRENPATVRQDAKLNALINAMAGRSEAEQLELLQEVMKRDPDAAQTWLQMSRLDDLKNGRNDKKVEALEETLLFTPEGMQQFVQGGAQESVDEYQDATKDLRWFIDNHGVAMTPESLDAAIIDYKNKQGKDWNDRLNASQQRLIDDGERILDALDDPRMQMLSDEQRRAIMAAMVDPESPAGTTVLTAALNQKDGVKPEVLDGAMEFFAETGLRDAHPMLATTVADARVRQVGRSIEAIDPADPTSIARARADIGKLREDNYAELRGIDEDKLDELDAAVDALQATIKPNGDAGDREDSLKEFAKHADALDAGGDGTASESLRLLALTGATTGSTEAPTPGLIDLVGLSADSATLLEEAKLISGGKLVGALTGDVLGGVLAGLSIFELLSTLQEGNVADSVLAGASTALSVGALFASGALATSLFAGAGVILFAAGLGLEQWRHVRESNQYMTEEAATFLQHSGLEPAAAQALTDQSGNGHSPVPFLFAYAQSRGLDQQQTIAWLNSLDPEQLSWARDRAHHALDDANGDLDQLSAPDPEGAQIMRDAPLGIVLTTYEPDSLDEFEAMLELNGIPLPTS